MPSSPKTPYLNLPLYELNDSQTKFLEFWQSIALNADGTNNALSAFQLIDAAYHALDSKVDDVSSHVVKEYDNKAAFPTTGVANGIYIDKSTNMAYRWDGAAYAQLNPTTAIEQTIASMQSTITTMQTTIDAMPDDIYNRVAQLLNDAIGGSY